MGNSVMLYMWPLYMEMYIVLLHFGGISIGMDGCVVFL